MPSAFQRSGGAFQPPEATAPGPAAFQMLGIAVVIATLAATEVNADAAFFSVEFPVDPAPPSQEGASVVIVEIPVQTGGTMSIISGDG